MMMKIAMAMRLQYRARSHLPHENGQKKKEKEKKKRYLSKHYVVLWSLIDINCIGSVPEIPSLTCEFIELRAMELLACLLAGWYVGSILPRLAFIYMMHLHAPSQGFKQRNDGSSVAGWLVRVMGARDVIGREDREERRNGTVGS